MGFFVFAAGCWLSKLGGLGVGEVLEPNAGQVRCDELEPDLQVNPKRFLSSF